MTRLTARSRMLVAIGAVLLLGMFVTPLWRIDLVAPQYPEGLGMLIRLGTITGIKPADLDNINGLNHYIGMQRIDPDAIPVLALMPWVVGGLAALGLLVAAAGRRAFVGVWLAAFALAGAAGLAEFYRWSYDYGHNLADDAVIKVPGMTYQPPLIGTKQLLNFTAASWPAAGSWLAALAFTLGVLALLPWKRLDADAPHRSLGLVVLLALLGCAPAGPVPIAYGEADCAQCRMRITDSRYGGEAISATGTVQQFDAVPCLARYVQAAAQAPREILVVDFDHPGSLVRAADARFIVRRGVGAGMENGVVAVMTTDTAALRRRFAVASVSWDSVRALAASGALPDDARAAHAE